MMKIKCPNCQRILGDTKDSLEANLNCRGCKQTVSVKVKMVHTPDYLQVTKLTKEKKNDKSK